MGGAGGNGKRSVRATLLASAAVGLALTIPTAAQGAQTLPSVTTRLSISTTGTFPEVLSEVTLRVPRRWKEVERLEDTSLRDEQTFSRLLVALFDRVGVFPEFRSGYVVRRAAKLPGVGIHAGIAEFRFRERHVLGYYDATAGPWDITPAGRDLVFRIGRSDKPIGAAWFVSVSFGPGVTIDTATRGAVTAETMLRRWQFSKGSAVTEVFVRATPAPDIQRRLSTNDVRNYLRRISLWLAFALIPLLVVYQGRRGALATGGSSPPDDADRPARRIAAATLGLVAAVLVVETLSTRWVTSWALRQFDESYYAHSLVEGAQVFAVALALAFIVPRVAAEATRRVYLVGAAVALLTVTANVPRMVASWPTDDRVSSVLRGGVATALSTVSVCVVVAMLAVVTFRAVGRLAIRDLGAGTIAAELFGRSGVRAPPLLTKVAGLVGASATRVAALALGGYWVLSSYLDAEYFGGPTLAYSLRSFPFALLGTLTDLSWLLFLFALLAVLAAAGSFKARETDAIIDSRRSVLWILALALAAWTIGTDGWLGGFAAPVPAIATLLVFALVTQRHLEARRDAIQAANESTDPPAPPFGSVAFRSEMLSRARAIAAIRRWKKTLYDDYRARELTEEAYDRAYREADEQEERERRGRAVPTEALVLHPPPRTLRALMQSFAARGANPPPSPPPPRRLVALPEGSSPFDFALSLGPRATWWENGKLAGLLAAILASVPLARYGYEYTWLWPGLGPVNIFTDFALELARWVVAGVVFGCCYAYLPGKLGPSKAVALVAPIGVAAALFEALPGKQLPPRLSSNIFLLALFLVVIGGVMDWLTLRGRRIDARHLGDLYQLHKARKFATLAPVALAIVGVANTIAGGDWGDLRDLFKGFFDLIGKF